MGSDLAQALTGRRLPDVPLAATDGRSISFARLAGTTVIFVYPRTSPPGEASIPGWDEIPGAKGCTPQTCGFRDHYEELREAGASEVFGLSVQDTDFQRDVVARLHLPFALLSDVDLLLQQALGLPTFEAGGMTLLTRMALVLRDGIIVRVFHPVDAPAENAEEVLRFLQGGH